MKTNMLGRKKICVLSLAVLLALGTAVPCSVVTAWAAPSGGSVKADSINVRKSANGDIAFSLKKGDKVEITDEEEGSDGHTWYEISVESDGEERTGWVRSDLVDTSGDTEDEEDTDEQSSDNDTDSDQGAEGAFTVDGKSYDIVSKIPKSKIPDDFAATTVSYQGKDVAAVKFEKGDLVLLYLEPASGSGKEAFYVYDSDQGTVLPFVKIDVGNEYVIFTDVPEDEVSLISTLYTSVECDFQEGKLPAYQQSAAADNTAAAADLTAFYYLYGVSKSGEAGWYTYDANDGSAQRSIVNMQYRPQESADEKEDGNASADDINSTVRMIVGVLGVICLLLLILTIIFSVRYRRLARSMDEYEDWDDDYYEDGEYPEDEYYGDEEYPEDEYYDDGEYYDEDGYPEDGDAGEEYLDDPEEDDYEYEEEQSGRRPLFGRLKSRRREPEDDDNMLEVDLPGGPVNLLDLDAEDQEGYDMVIPPRADYDLIDDNTSDQEEEFDRLSAMLEKRLSQEINGSGDE